MAAPSPTIPPLAPAPPGWTYKGCHEDTILRILNGAFDHHGTLMTVERCISKCEAEGFRFAGLETGDQYMCIGNQRCGDDWRMNLYESQSRAPNPPPASSPNPVAPTSSTRPAATPAPSSPSSPSATSRSTDPSTSAQPSTDTSTSHRSDTRSNTSPTSTLPTNSNSSSGSSGSISTSPLTTQQPQPPRLDQIFTPGDHESPKPSISSAAVAGIAVSVTALVGILVALLICRLRRSRKRRLETASMAQQGSLNINPYAPNDEIRSGARYDALPEYSDIERDPSGTSPHSNQRTWTKGQRPQESRGPSSDRTLDTDSVPVVSEVHNNQT
ncbi:hypothetical protein CVT24_005091 [Panaeolus cyanescens]|uniref:WSC domain-containing protein n=1 Tax=Panaeolus cyanescens TaxID=181874 RepID=A0A409W249_9AGAR|nr:hypothetical protein CVT24_005091 [Panaeolus cyanescens]